MTGENQPNQTEEKTETTAPQKPKKDPEAVANVARQTMVGDIRDTVLDILRDKRYTGKAWKDMKEAEQREVTAMIVDRLREAVVRAIDIIQSDGEKHIKAILKQVTVKDGYKGVFECSAHDELRHELVDAQGSVVLIVMTNSDEYLGEREKVKFDKDQPDLPATGAEETDESEEEADDKTDEDEDSDEESELEKEADDLT